MKATKIELEGGATLLVRPDGVDKRNGQPLVRTQSLAKMLGMDHDDLLKLAEQMGIDVVDDDDIAPVK